MSAGKAVDVVASEKLHSGDVAVGGFVDLNMDEKMSNCDGVDVVVERAEAVATDDMFSKTTEDLAVKGNDANNMDNSISKRRHGAEITEDGHISEELVEIGVANEALRSLEGESKGMNMDTDAPECRNESPTTSTDGLPTIFEIAGVDSSNDSLPDNMNYHLSADFASPSSHKRNSTPVGAFLRSGRQAKLQKAAGDSDFEMQQLDQQLALTQQYTNEVIAMRREQSKLEEELKTEKREIAARNEQLVKELQQLEVSAEQISHAEKEVAILANVYKTQLQSVQQEKAQLMYNTIHTMHPPTGNVDHMLGTMRPSVNNHMEDANKEMAPHLVASSHSSETLKTTIDNVDNNLEVNVPMVECKTSDGSMKSVPLYSKGMRIYHKSTATKIETPAIIVDAHLDGNLEPYYLIQFEDGREKQTDNDHIRLLEVDEFWSMSRFKCRWQ